MRLTPTVLGIGLALVSAQAHADQPRAVLELFTSQGCSSCPKADRLAGELAKEKDLVVLTFAVDYWDYLGWKDTFGAAAHSARQRAYANVRGDRKVFTPQMIVNGSESATGSDRAGIIAAIERTKSEAGLLAVPVDVVEEGGQIEVELDAGPANNGEVWLVAVASHRRVEIDRGENKSRTIDYTNVVRRMTRLGAWEGKPCQFKVARAEAVPADADRYLVLVQEGSGSMPGTILGVRSTD
jgi:hypothetical protein